MSADASSETNDTNNNSNKFDAGSNNSIVGKILVMSNDLIKQQTDKELNNNNSKQVSPPQTPSTATTDKMAPPVTVVESTTQQQVAAEDASSPPPHTVIQCDTQQQVCSRLLSDTNEEDKDEDADKAPRSAPQEQNNQPATQTNHTIDSASSKPNTKKLHSTTVAINQSNPSAAESQEKAKKGVTSLPLNTIAANGQSNPLENTQSPTKANRLQEGQSPNDYNQSGNNNNNTNNYNHLNKNSNNHSYIGTTTTTPATTPTTTPTITEATTKRQHRLSFFQSLILRKWPYLALAILTMSSLMFAIILSAFTIYLMHGSVDCGSLALAAAGSSASASSIPAGSVSASSGGSHHNFHMPHELVLGSHHHRPPPPTDFESPIELASGIGGSVAASPENLSGRLSLTSSIGASDTSSSSSLQARQQQPVAVTTFERLPRSIWPQHYDLFIWPYIAEPFNFSGKVSIHLKCREPTDNITLHTLDLKLDEQSIRLDGSPTSNAGGAVPKVTGLSQDKQLQHSIIKLDSQLKRDQIYVLSMDFTGTLNDDLNGFYKIKYERQNSTELSWIAATQFQATDARRAFPCFDEPIYKATFGIKIKHWKNMTALSNMPIINREDSPDGLWVTDTFAKSHQMSTYLVAYAVTNFESRSEGNISVWTRPGLTHTAEYALKIAGKILRYYEEFFGIEYPLPKMDMIALPDFNAGAMENWGLITYRESSMLYDETSSSVANKERVAIVVAHELAHQWFGNLVTPKWWDDLWLNEGFASFVEYIGVDHVEPGWKMLDQFVTEEVQGVFRLDSLSSSHQISIPVNNPDEISEIFDHISYSKGASIIRMMLHFLTKDVFKLGLQRYLRALKYSNAEQSDLWAYLTEAQHVISKQSGNITSNNGYSMNNQPEINVERVMNTWTLQTGFPIVTLTRSYDGSRTATLEQLRYQLYKTPLPTAASMEGGQPKNNTNPSRPLSGAQKWEIPITYTWKSEQNWEPRTRAWMHQNDSSALRLHAEQLPESDNEWILLNLDHVGYYRVNYDRRNWQLLIDQLNEDHTKIKTTNRAQLLDDIFELAKSGDVEYKFALEATRYLKKEQDFLPWDTALGAFSYIDEMLKRTPLYGEWEDYVRDLTAPYYGRYKHLEWTMDGSGDGGANATTMFGTNDILEENNQVLAVAWACQVDKHCINKAKRVFNVWKQTGVNRINPALRYATYCTAIENGDRSDWDFLWKNYEKEQSASERDRILRSLGCSKEVWILSRYLEWIFDKTKPIRRQDGSFVFRVIANNNNGRDIAFNFMRERWQQIKEHYGKTSFSMGHLIRSISTSMNTQTELNQLVAFYDTVKNDVGNGKRSFQIAIEEVDGNIMWKNRNYKILEDWIQSELKKSAKIN